MGAGCGGVAVRLRGLTAGAARHATRREKLRRFVATAILAAGCGASDVTFDRFVLVTYDTTRADHLGAYGYPRATSPFFDSLAARGVLFERAIAPLPSTVPSHATMFTALHPLEHGVGHNGMRLGEQIPTAAELFRDAGYTTAAFVSLGMLRNSGLRRGFEQFEVRGVRGRPEADPAEPAAQETTAAVIAWLRRQSAESRFFLWVHYYDPHTPYAPQEEPLAALRAESGEIVSLRDLLLGPQAIRLSVHGDDVERMLGTVDLYDGELRAMDDKLRRLYAAFDDFGLSSRTAWIVAGDHGEGLGSHDWLQHGVRVYQEQMRVPLLVHAPNARWPARRVDAIVELVDLLPTLADLAGFAPPIGGGVSLVPYLEGGSTGAGEREALVQRRIFTGVKERSRPRSELGEWWEDGERLGLVGRRWKYVHWTAGPPELYDLEADPAESRNLALYHREVAAAMESRLLARVRELRSRRRQAGTADEGTLEILRSLGYLQ